MSNSEDNIINLQNTASGDESFLNETQTDNGMPALDQIDKLLGLDQVQTETPVKATAGQVKFTPKVPVKNNPVPVPETNPAIDAQIKQLEARIAELARGINGVKIGPVPQKPVPLDFTKLTEKDVFNLDIPIEAVDHGIPDYMDVELADSNYVPRWVHKSPRRLGPMMAMGFTYVGENELANKLKLEIKPDENGQYKIDDVILMKCTKAKYFGMLRKNFLRAKMMVDPKFAHKVAQNRVQEDLRSARPEGPGDKTAPGDFSKYASANKLDVYI